MESDTVKHRRVMEISRRWSPPEIKESRDIDVATHGNVTVDISNGKINTEMNLSLILISN